MRTEKTSGFTLIELLVVIAIIAILAAILFPVFARARDKGRQAACTSNEKQMSLAFLMYADDYDERFPAGSWGGRAWNWSMTIEPYIKNASLGVWRCPSINLTFDGAGKQVPLSGDYVTYGANGELTGDWDNAPVSKGGAGGYGTSDWPPKQLAEVKTPASVVIFYEDPQAVPRIYGRPQPAASVDYIMGYPAYYDKWSFFKTHNGGSNFTMVDGHVKWFRYGRVGGTEGPAKGKDAWFLPSY
jgi:prepilin-type N-terminal cleavage/methylation domain-containing protein/prepilin-type processing-associated H-X9-DG protein